MLTFEILPLEGKVQYLVGYIDLSFKEHTPDETMIALRAMGKISNQYNKLFDTIDSAAEFMNKYLEQLKRYLNHESAPQEGWIWTK